MKDLKTVGIYKINNDAAGLVCPVWYIEGHHGQDWRVASPTASRCGCYRRSVFEP